MRHSASYRLTGLTAGTKRGMNASVLRNSKMVHASSIKLKPHPAEVEQVAMCGEILSAVLRPGSEWVRRRRTDDRVIRRTQVRDHDDLLQS